MSKNWQELNRKVKRITRRIKKLEQKREELWRKHQGRMEFLERVLAA